MNEILLTPGLSWGMVRVGILNKTLSAFIWSSTFRFFDSLCLWIKVEKDFKLASL